MLLSEQPITCQTHACAFNDLDYIYNSAKILTHIVCRVCGRKWVLSIVGSERGRIGLWRAWPCWRPRQDVEPWPLPPQDVLDTRRAEIAASRQERLNMLDRIERERSEMFAEQQAVMDRVAARGKGPKRFAYSGIRDRKKLSTPGDSESRDVARSQTSSSAGESGLTFTKVSVFRSLRAQTDRIRRNLEQG